MPDRMEVQGPTRSRVRLGLLPMAVLLIGVLNAQEASAQFGLFPNWPIKRERVPHELENPIHHYYRYQYWGHYPTCWRQFPDGHGCASAAFPDRAAEYAERPLVIPEGLDDTGPILERSRLPFEDLEEPQRPDLEIPPLNPDDSDPFNFEEPLGQPRSSNLTPGASDRSNNDRHLETVSARDLWDESSREVRTTAFEARPPMNRPRQTGLWNRLIRRFGR